MLMFLCANLLPLLNHLFCAFIVNFILRFIFPIVIILSKNHTNLTLFHQFLTSLSSGSAEAAGSEDVEQECGHQGSQDPHEAEDWRRQSCAEEEAAGPGERVGEGVSDVSGQTEQTGGSLQGNWTVQVLHCSSFYLSFFVCFCVLIYCCALILDMYSE